MAAGTRMMEYDIRDFEVYDSGYTFFYSPQEWHKPSYPVDVIKIYRDSLNLTDINRYPYAIFKSKDVYNIVFRFESIDKQELGSLINTIGSFSGTLNLKIGTVPEIANKSAFIKAYVFEDIVIRETQVSMFDIDLTVTAFDDVMIIDPTGIGWGGTYGLIYGIE